MKQFGGALLLFTVLLTACTRDSLAEAGVMCDPMAYQNENEVWVLRDGSATGLTVGGLIETNPSLSPDGLRIAFTSGSEEDLDLFVMNADGSDRSLIWAGETLQSSADWSPNGEALVFDQIADDGNVQVFTIGVDGSDLVQLTEGQPNAKPTWTSDGQTILFLSLRDGEAQEIYSMTPEGEQVVNLTNHPARDVLAEMSPDGDEIVFVSDRSGNMDVWMMAPDGSNPRQLTAVAERDTNPTWTSDGEHILFRSDRGPVGLWSMSPDGTNQQPLLEGGWLAGCP